MSQAVAHYLSHVCKLFYLGHELWWLYRSELNHYSSLSLVCWASRPEQILYFAHCIHNYGASLPSPYGHMHTHPSSQTQRKHLVSYFTVSGFGFFIFLAACHDV